MTGFVQVASFIGPALTIASSGNVFKASAQVLLDKEFKKRTGKSSLNYFKEEVSKNNSKNNINKDFENMIITRVERVHKRLIEQNNQTNFDKEFKLLVEKRFSSTRKKLKLKN
ncbi:hypothetical protein OBA37_01920 [Candidatus Pelagibacter sp.]|nr:hypothetical protein [Candidatus Pelagibacter sp.]